MEQKKPSFKNRLQEVIAYKMVIHFLGRITPFGKLQVHFIRNDFSNIQINWICFNFCIKLLHGNNILIIIIMLHVF